MSRWREPPATASGMRPPEARSNAGRVSPRGGAVNPAGEPARAREYYLQALQVAATVHNRPEAALTRLELAELLLKHYPNEHMQAVEHLDFAITEFGEMKMQPALERALKHKGLLHA